MLLNYLGTKINFKYMYLVTFIIGLLPALIYYIYGTPHIRFWNEEREKSSRYCNVLFRELWRELIDQTSHNSLHFVFCILYSVFCILYSVLCILYSVFCILYSLFCILYSVFCIVLYAEVCYRYYVFCLMQH